MEEKNLTDWLSKYQIIEPSNPKNIGILMAGNIPAVGFHDLLCVLISGHIASVKLSSSDSVLVTWLIGQLIAIEPSFALLIKIEDMLKSKDAYIAKKIDPTTRKEHTQWLVNKYKSGDFKLSEGKDIKKALSQFEDAKPHLQSKDLNSIKSYSFR